MDDIYEEIKTKEDFARANRETLYGILKDNKDTEYGIKNGFADIKDDKEYAGRVPVSGFSDYEDYIDRMVAGEKDLITAYPVYSLLKTSGSTGKNKLIPITEKAFAACGDLPDRYQLLHNDECGGKRLFLTFLVVDLNKDPGEAPTYLSSAYYRSLYDRGRFVSKTLAGGVELTFFPVVCDFMYVKLWTAFATEDITSIESVFLYDNLVFFHRMEEEYNQILDDMEAGRVSEKAGLPEEMKKSLLALPVSPERIAYVRRECDRGFEGRAKRLWKDLSLVSGISSKAFQVEEISSKKYLGDIPIWYFFYGTTECFMAIPLSTDTYDYILYPGLGYYELREEKTDRFVDMAELKEGECYEIVITNFSGFYRYAMGDILEFRGYHDGYPVIRYMYRRSLMMNIIGEKIDMATLDLAVRTFSERLDIPVWQYSFYEDYAQMPACYHGIIALDREVSGTAAEYADELDAILRSLSTDYNESRDLGEIGMAKIEIVDKDGFLKMREERNLDKGQSKPQHIWRN